MIKKNAVIVAAALFAACSGKPAGPDRGIIKDGFFFSRYFQMSLRIPAAWAVEHPPDRLDLFMEYLAKLIAHEDKDCRRLLRISPLPIPLLRPQDPLVTVVSVAKGHGDLLSARRALDMARHLVAESKMPARIEKEAQKIKLGGVEFDRMTIRFSLKEGDFFQVIHAAIVRDAILIVGVGSKSEKGIEQADIVLKSISFDDAGL